MLQALDQISGREERHLDENAPHRCLGMPTGAVHTTNQYPRYGDLLCIDPTNATEPIVVALPAGDRAKRGFKVTVKNYSASAKTIRVAAREGETIDTLPSKDMTTPWQLATFVLLGAHEWTCFRGDGYP